MGQYIKRSGDSGATSKLQTTLAPSFIQFNHFGVVSLIPSIIFESFIGSSKPFNLVIHLTSLVHINWHQSQLTLKTNRNSSGRRLCRYNSILFSKFPPPCSGLTSADIYFKKMIVCSCAEYATIHIYVLNIILHNTLMFWYSVKKMHAKKIPKWRSCLFESKTRPRQQRNSGSNGRAPFLAVPRADLAQDAGSDVDPGWPRNHMILAWP